ncbi:MAG: hypothetical protein FD155_3460 [Bacteroidetes bacterium]|nr:MAG: hypothetical protein FD155_3460 [Bacteroidota bacterium]
MKEKVTNRTPQWRYPFIVVYKCFAYLPALFYALFMKFNILQCYRY